MKKQPATEKFTAPAVPVPAKLESPRLIADAEIVSAWHGLENARAEFQKSSLNYTVEAVRVGLLFREFRAQILGENDDYESSILGRNQYSEGDGFLKKMDSLGIPIRTVYSRIESARRIVTGAYKKQWGDKIPLEIEVESRVIPLSECLKLPENRLSGPALEFKQLLFNFVGDMTISEATRAAMNGESNPSRISRAANGKINGGGAPGPKPYGEYITAKFQNLASFLTLKKDQKVYDFRKFQETQRAAIVAALQESMEKWPRWMLTAAAEKLKSEVTLNDFERIHRSDEF